YIVELLQGFVDFLDQKNEDFDEIEFEHKLLQLKEIVKEFAEDNPRLSDLLLQVLDEIEQDKAKFMGQDISVIINQMRYAAIDKEIEKFSSKWFVPYDDVKYEAYNFKDGELANENKLKALADYATYKEQTPDALPKFKFNGTLVKEFKEVLMPEISLLLE
ncbi:MAG: type I restriction endonuclease subunit R, partial [Agathobacter sp.]|nr:type I restriction endonuclease subunit R [Agathobacter sp.]